MSYFKKQADIGSKDHVRAHNIAACQTYQELQERGLLSDPMDWNVRDNNGNTALILAAEAGNASLVRVLVEKGRTDLTLMNKQKKSAVMVATDPQIRNLIRDKYPHTTMPSSVKHFAEIDPEYTMNMCLQWVSQGKTRNVLTRKTITKSKGVYNDWVKVCNALGVDVSSRTASPEAGPSTSRRSSSGYRSNSDGLDEIELELAMRLSKLGMDEAMNPATEFAVRKCGNMENPITLEEFGEDEDDDQHIFTIRAQQPNGSFVRKGTCMLRSNLLEYIQGDANSVRASPNNPEQYVPSNIFLSEWVQNPASRILLDESNTAGYGGMPSHRIHAKMPPQTFITLKSLYRIFDEPNVKEWFALPLYDGNSKRLGNLFGMFFVSSTHGQLPGFTLYKLYRRDEIRRGMKAQADPNEYSIQHKVVDKKLPADTSKQIQQNMVVPIVKAIAQRIRKK